MKIRKRITYTFTGLFGLIVLILCVIIFLISANSRSNLFFDQLERRLKITEKFFLESDNLSHEIQNKLRDKFLKTLPEEIEYAHEIKSFQENMPADARRIVPQNILSKLSESEPYEWTSDSYQGIAQIFNISGEKYVVLVIAHDEYGHQYLNQLKIILISSFILCLVITYLVSHYFSGKVLKPISEKIKKANKISANNLDLRLTVYNKHDELGMLALSFNNLLDRLQNAFELQKNFVRYASHELKNPLAVILGEAEITLMQQRSQNEYISTIQKIKSKAERLNLLVDQFLKLSQLEKLPLKKERITLDELLMDVIFNVSQTRPDNINIDFNLKNNGDNRPLTGDADLLYNAFFNLIENAVKFTPDGGDILIEQSAAEGSDKTQVLIKDQGIGISEKDLESIFEPLYRGNNAHSIEGTGIGLALVHKIIQLHGGTIDINSELGKGSEFTIIL